MGMLNSFYENPARDCGASNVSGIGRDFLQDTVAKLTKKLKYPGIHSFNPTTTVTSDHMRLA